MIIGRFYPEKIGSIIAGLYEFDKNKEIEMIVYILRQVTYEDWKAYRESEGRYYHIEGEEKGYFYEVSTD